MDVRVRLWRRLSAEELMLLNSGVGEDSWESLGLQGDPTSPFFASDGQSIGVSASASVLPMNTQDWSPLGWTVGSPCCPRDSQEFSPTPQFKSINSSAPSFLHSPTLISIHDHWKTIALARWTFVGKVIPLLLNILSRLVITFLPRSKHLLISWLWSPSTVILEPPKIKSKTVSTVSLPICHEVMGPDAILLVFWMLSFKPTFSLSSFPESPSISSLSYFHISSVTIFDITGLIHA